jgi:hypothetical protein
MPGGADTTGSECCRRPAKTAHGSGDGVVSDAVEAGLQSSPGAGDDMIGDLLL